MGQYWECVEVMQARMRQESAEWDQPLDTPTHGFFDVATWRALQAWVARWGDAASGWGFDAAAPDLVAFRRRGMAEIYGFLRSKGWNDARITCLQQAWAEFARSNPSEVGRQDVVSSGSNWAPRAAAVLVLVGVAVSVGIVVSRRGSHRRRS